ncbi:MAG TPA: aspartate ammonia-lyase [Candidatus Nitrosopolaris sp.]|nr:aspartate ammonia-lyase [Candidatus Nitrosopolaris sp.]
MSFRVDKDSLGEVKVPSGAYYGPFTVRASLQYTVTGEKSHPDLIHAYAMIKRSAALANMELKILDRTIANAIIESCDEILANNLQDQFIIDAINSGAGTALNMNINEVVANRALEILGKQKGEYGVISPNDHVNMSQSSNDTFPTAMHVAIICNILSTISAVKDLIKSLERKAIEFKDAIKIGRTHLMDAVPITLGIEFGEYAYSLEIAKKKLYQAIDNLLYVGLGGTAVGTGVNSPKGFSKIAIRHLSEISGLDLKLSPNIYYCLQSKFDVANCSSALRNLALELIKMANDLRLMTSGPNAGFAEIVIPAVHAGSSIMPGKVNPSLAECLNMICFNIVGNDVSVALAAQAGQFELNVMLPGMTKNVLDSAKMLKKFLPTFAKNMVDGIVANWQTISSQVDKSPILVTLLNPYIGYLNAAEIYKESVKTGITVRQLILNRGLMSKEELDRVLSKDNLLGSRD